MRGIAPLIGTILLLAAVALVFMRPGAITGSACYTPGGTLDITNDPIKTTAASSNAFMCVYLPYTNTQGTFVWSSQCKSIGSVSSGQTILSQKTNIFIPSNVQPQQSSRVAITINSENAAAEGTSGMVVPQFRNAISPEDTAWVEFKSQCPVPITTGERQVFYFQNCDNTDPNQGKLVYCEREFFSGATSYCTTSKFVFCEQDATCLEKDGVGICFQQQGPAFAKCGDQWDNRCPAGCLLYQDRDCCVQSGAEWDVLGSVCRTKSGETVSTKDQLTTAKQQQVKQGFIALIIGSLILALMIQIIVIALGLVLAPLRVLTYFLWTPTGFIISLSALSVIFIIFASASAAGAASLVGIT